MLERLCLIQLFPQNLPGPGLFLNYRSKTKRTPECFTAVLPTASSRWHKPAALLGEPFWTILRCQDRSWSHAGGESKTTSQVVSLFLGVAGRINRVLRRQVVTHPRSQLPHWGYGRNFARHQPQNSPLLLLNTIDMNWLAGSTSTAFATMNSCATVS